MVMMADWSLTVRQPWAALIVAGHRPLECRNFRPVRARPGDRLFIVSGLVVTHADLDLGSALLGSRLCVFDGQLHELVQRDGDETAWPLIHIGRFGSIVGSVRFDGVHPAAECVPDRTCAHWAVPGYDWHWELSDAAVMAGPAFRGHQGIRRYAT